MRIAARIGTLLFVLLTLAVVAAPSLLTGPAVAQTESHLDWAFRLEQYGLPLAIVALLAALAVTALQWKAPTGWPARIAMSIGVVLAGVAVWGSTTNMVQQFFDPLEGGRYVSIAEADHVQDEEPILGVVWKDEALIYPVGIIGYHHIVNERLKGEPFVVTY